LIQFFVGGLGGDIQHVVNTGRPRLESVGAAVIGYNTRQEGGNIELVVVVNFGVIPVRYNR